MPKKKKSVAPSPEVAPQPKESKPAGRPRRKRRWLLPVLLIAGLGLLWAAPILVARTSLRSYALASVCGDLQGEIRAETMSLDWFSPVVVRNLSWHGTDGEILLRADSLSSDHTLLDLVAHRADAGTLRIESPQLRLEVRPDGSNLEDALQNVLNRQDEAPSTTAFALAVSDGRVEIVESFTDRQTELSDVSLQLQSSHEPLRSLAIAFSANVQDEEQTGRADVQLELGENGPASMAVGSASFKLERCPLAVLGALLRRSSPELELGGRLTCDFEMNTSGDADTPTTIRGQASCKQLVLQNPAWLGDDRVELEEVAAGGQAELLGQWLTLDDVRVDTDLARMQLSGTADMSSFGEAGGISRVLTALGSDDLSAKGHVDLAALASALPNTLRVRAGTTLTAGDLDWELVSRRGESNREWRGRLITSALEARDGNRRIEWRDPIQISFAGHQSADEAVIDEFSCRSSFLQATAQGTLSDARVQAQGDLGRLATELGRFFDLGDVRLAGRLNGDLACRRRGERDVTAEGTFVVADLLWSHPGRQPWREQRLEVALRADATTADRSLEQIEAGTLSVVSGQDRLQAKLIEPWRLDSEESTLPVSVNLQGNVAAWTARLQPWLRFENWTLGGNVNLQTLARLSKQELQFESATIELQQFLARGPAIRVEEPSLRIEGSGTWDRIERRLTSQQTILSSRTLALRMVDLDAQLPQEGAPLVSGGLAARADLARLGNWLDRGSVDLSRRLTGSVVCQVKFSQSNHTTSAAAEIESKDLVLWTRTTASTSRGPAQQWKRSFSDPQLTVNANAEWDRSSDQIALSHLDVDSKLMKLSSHGRVEQVSNRRIVDLQGVVEYDLDNVTAVLQSVFGPEITISGRDKREFTIRGPLASNVAAAIDPRHPVAAAPAVESWSGRAGLGWASANVSGLPIGAGALNLVMSDGMGQFEPLDLSIGAGRLSAQPTLDLTNAPVALLLERGATLEDVQLSEQVCESWLKYVAPILAQTTRADGRFSVQLDRAWLPVLRMSSGSLAGNLNIQSAQIRPGPMAQQFVWLADQIQRVIERDALRFTANRETKLVSIDNQNVAFEMKDGRVYHRGLEVTIGKVLIRTSGSVGFDQSLNLTAEVPIQDDWVDGDRYLSALRGQVLQVPVRGTVSQPQLDARALGEITGRVGTSAIRGRVQDELQKQLGRLLNND